MAKRYKFVLFLLFIVLLAAAVVVATGVLDINKQKNRRVAPPGETPADYTEFFRTDTNAALPLLKTTLENVYCTVSTEGEVQFYELKNGALETVKETGSYEVRAECGSELLPAEIHYVETDAGTYGCGLFTNELYKDVNYFEYGFFQVTDQFPGFDGDLLLMIDVEKDRFWSNEKVFSEIFTMDAESHELSRFLSENQRQVEMSGRMRSDYKMFTNDLLNQTGGTVLFLSSRYYGDYAASGKVDILTSGGSGENVDNNRYAEDLASLNFWRTDGGVLFFRNTGEGFSLMRVKEAGGEAETVRAFEGNLSKDYLLSGACLLRRDSGEVYNVLTGERSFIDYSGFRENFAADLFTASPNGKYCVIRGVDTDTVAAVAAVNLETGDMHSYTDDMFGYVAAMSVADDGAAVLSLTNGKSATSFYQLLADLK